MSTPDPSVIRKLTKVAEHHLSQLRNDYTFLFPTAYNVRRGGGGEKVVTKTHSDVSGLMTGDHERFRRHIDDAGKAMFEAERRVMIARNHLSSACDLLDKHRALEMTPEERALPHPADQGDLKRARQAQKRRQNRAFTGSLPWSQEEITG